MLCTDQLEVPSKVQPFVSVHSCQGRFKSVDVFSVDVFRRNRVIRFDRKGVS